MKRIYFLHENDHYEEESIEDLSLQLEGLLETRLAAEEKINEVKIIDVKTIKRKINQNIRKKIKRIGRRKVKLGFEIVSWVR